MTPRAQISLTPEAHRAFVIFTAQLTGMLERRVTQSEALTAAITVAQRHEAEIEELLK
jgi:hypothetical protein